MPDEKGLLSELLATCYPTDYVVAVIDDPNAGQRAFDALRQAGFPAWEIELRRGEDVVQHGFFSRLRRALQTALSDEVEACQQYEQEVRAGHAIITVRGDDPRKVEAARRILLEQGAHTMKHYGNFVLTDLD
jgi:hypothetical protein